MSQFLDFHRIIKSFRLKSTFKVIDSNHKTFCREIQEYGEGVDVWTWEVWDTTFWPLHSLFAFQNVWWIMRKSQFSLLGKNAQMICNEWGRELLGLLSLDCIFSCLLSFCLVLVIEQYSQLSFKNTFQVACQILLQRLFKNSSLHQLGDSDINICVNKSRVSCSKAFGHTALTVPFTAVCARGTILCEHSGETNASKTKPGQDKLI